MESEDEWFQDECDDKLRAKAPLIEKHGLSLWYIDVDKIGAAIDYDDHCNMTGSAIVGALRTAARMKAKETEVSASEPWNPNVDSTEATGSSSPRAWAGTN